MTRCGAACCIPEVRAQEPGGLRPRDLRSAQFFLDSIQTTATLAVGFRPIRAKDWGRTHKGRERGVMRKASVVFAAVPMLFVLATPASAQFMKEYNRVGIDLRLGALWQQGMGLVDHKSTRFAVGGRFFAYLGKKSLLHRLSAQVAVDYVPLWSTKYYDEWLGSVVKLSEHILVLNPRLGFDVVQTSQFDFTVHYGSAGYANRNRIALPNIYGEFEDVCYLDALEGACPSDWRFLGNAGAGFRVFPKKGLPFYIGADYTRYGGRKNQLVGTVGLSF